ncbi:hypothetical protein OQ252_11715 [Acetobacter farinalis]|uniref:Uncharacterized protein n=1 Tax=Acetobacter farinalis TaxID=1260984 RepID=A0ABT3Q9T8_9PROT|nr:hypothetical protein [Acetobacter farinalis]MCX2562056.1 hypothetical protein [Acetobacter farinalis]NHO30660.1 hypothetical protein [Acetobacter farinalis]
MLTCEEITEKVGVRINAGTAIMSERVMLGPMFSKRKKAAGMREPEFRPLLQGPAWDGD